MQICLICNSRLNDGLTQEHWGEFRTLSQDFWTSPRQYSPNSVLLICCGTWHGIHTIHSFPEKQWFEDGTHTGLENLWCFLKCPNATDGHIPQAKEVLMVTNFSQGRGLSWFTACKEKPDEKGMESNLDLLLLFLTGTSLIWRRGRRCHFRICEHPPEVFI